MNHYMFPLLSLLALSFLAIPSPSYAEDFGFGTFGGSPAVASLGRDGSSVTRAATSTLPSSFGSTDENKAQVFASDAELAASHASNNVLVLAGLAGLLGVGMTITGICMLRRKPTRAPTRIMVNA